jgi:hypothetical protein
LGYHYRNSRTSYSDNSISRPFFREWARRPKTDISPARDRSRLGFQVIVQRNVIPRPFAYCRGTRYNFEKEDRNDELEYLQVKPHYFVYPFVIQQDPSKGAYIQQISKQKEVCKFHDTDTIHAPISIIGVGFEIEKDYNLKTNLSELRTKRLNSDELAEYVTLSLEEIKEPSTWRRFLSSFSVTRTRIPK